LKGARRLIQANALAYLPKIALRLAIFSDVVFFV
jgi:hypothetical protein